MLVALVLAGLVIGLMLGTLGGGGAILTTPILVYGFGESPRQATSTSLVVVLVASVSGLLAHAREGRVRWRQGLLFGLGGVVGAWAGARLAATVPERLLMGGFAVLLLAAAVGMWRGPVRAHVERRRGVAEWALVGLVATLVGLVTGFFGVGGGFVVVPALVLALGFPMLDAAATGLVVIAVNSLVALAVRGPDLVDPSVAVPIAAGALVGSLVGAGIAPHVPARRLQHGFALLLGAVAVVIGVQTGIA